MARTKTTGIVIHCSATAEQDIGRAEIDAWHRAKGWSGIGYHWVIRRDGTLEYGRAPDAIGAHVQGHNSTTVGICLIGGADAAKRAVDNFTPAQYATLRTLVAVLHRFYPAATVKGHRDYSPDLDGDGVIEPHEWFKGCPSFDVATWLTANPLPKAA